MAMRNLCYDWGLLKSRSFKIATVSVGNIRVGGTGKTPMIEYLTNHLQQRYNIAILSRGYGRKSKGFILVDENKQVAEVGDEALQLKNKFANITVAVCENRVEGIQRLMSIDNSLNLILLDDAFQHRRVRPFINILLSSYNFPLHKDLPFPAGRLREFPRAASRADCSIITKCPPLFPELNYTIAEPQFMSTIVYEKLNTERVFGTSALAQNEIFKEHLEQTYTLVGFKAYRDHYSYTQKDVDELNSLADGATVVCTAKDWSKLQQLKGTENYKVIHMRVKFKDEAAFTNWLDTKLDSFES